MSLCVHWNLYVLDCFVYIALIEHSSGFYVQSLGMWKQWKSFDTKYREKEIERDGEREREKRTHTKWNKTKSKKKKNCNGCKDVGRIKWEKNERLMIIETSNIKTKDTPKQKKILCPYSKLEVSRWLSFYFVSSFIVMRVRHKIEIP